MNIEDFISNRESFSQVGNDLENINCMRISVFQLGVGLKIKSGQTIKKYSICDEHSEEIFRGNLLSDVLPPDRAIELEDMSGNAVLIIAYNCHSESMNTFLPQNAQHGILRHKNDCFTTLCCCVAGSYNSMVYSFHLKSGIKVFNVKLKFPICYGAPLQLIFYGERGEKFGHLECGISGVDFLLNFLQKDLTSDNKTIIVVLTLGMIDKFFQQNEPLEKQGRRSKPSSSV